jgi:hypothetical protein
MERRAAKRKNIHCLDIEHVINNNTLKKICMKAKIVDTSTEGFLIVIERDDLIDDELKSSLNLDSLNDTSLSLYVPFMDLELDGTVGLTRHIGKGTFEVLVNFSEDTPKYWRECLMDLLPEPDEI